jgi:hypothetical protein
MAKQSPEPNPPEDGGNPQEAQSPAVASATAPANPPEVSVKVEDAQPNDEQGAESRNDSSNTNNGGDGGGANSGTQENAAVAAGDGSTTTLPSTGVTDLQWRSMMGVVMAIYSYREEECVWIPLLSFLWLLEQTDHAAVAMIRRDSSSAA